MRFSEKDEGGILSTGLSRCRGTDGKERVHVAHGEVGGGPVEEKTLDRRPGLVEGHVLRSRDFIQSTFGHFLILRDMLQCSLDCFENMGEGEKDKEVESQRSLLKITPP